MMEVVLLIVGALFGFLFGIALTLLLSKPFKIKTSGSLYVHKNEVDGTELYLVLDDAQEAENIAKKSIVSFKVTRR